MARISKRNPCYRTKEQMAADVAFILTAPVAYGTKAAVISQVCWAWTEFDGKYDGCPYWSLLALEVCGPNQSRERGWRKRLAHEHTVPKRIVLDMLMQLRDADAATVLDLLDRVLIGVVLLRSEHDLLNVEHSKTMPDEFFDPKSPSYMDPWLRYRRTQAAAATEGEVRALRIIRVCDGSRVV